MMMNIRGLAFDDPRNLNHDLTDQLHMRTLEFAHAIRVIHAVDTEETVI